MTFHDALFPTDIVWGSLGGPGGHSHVITTDSGVDEVVSRWSRKRRTWDIAYGMRTPTAIQTVQNFYVAHGGLDHTWRFKAPHDFSTNPAVTSDNYQGDPAPEAPTSTDALLGVGDGVTVDFQLRKAYTHSGYTGYIPILLPVTGTTVVSLDDVPQGSGWSVNLTTGIVTFSVAPGMGVNVKAGCEFHIEARFGEELDKQLPLAADSFSMGSVRSVPIVESMSGSRVNEDWIARGGGRLSFNAASTLVASQGYAWELVPASTGLSVTVEDAADMESGGDHYMFYNAGAHTVTLKGGATTIASLVAGADCKLVVFLVGSTKTWKAVS